MRQFQCKILAFLSILTLSCQQNTKKGINPTDVGLNQTVASNSDVLTVDLVALQKQGSLNKTAVITVQDDPVFHGVKHYNAISLPEVLETFTAIKKIELDKYQIVFECEDGYRPMMPLRKFLSVKSFIAVSDIDAPKGELWSKVVKEGQPKKIAPFYLIYEGVSAKDTGFKWPYNIVKIRLVPDSQNISLLFPKEDKTAQSGFELFKGNCIVCHSINKIGGSMGPELNYPKSVTEYWDKKQLKDFIKNPASFRNGVKMPTLTNLSEKEIEDIVGYLDYMATHKL